MLIVVVFLVYDGQRKYWPKIECVDGLFGKSDFRQRLSVMRLHMGTINSFCLDDGVRKSLLM